MIEQIGLGQRNNLFPNIQFLFRSHPAYLTHLSKRSELEAVFNQFNNADMKLMHPIVFDPDNKDYIVTQEDRDFMHQAFRVCDATVSIMSTWMIESAIFDKPNICIESGRYKTDLYDFDLSEYKAEHIDRIFRYGAVHRTRSFDELAVAINEIVENPNSLNEERSLLKEHETGPNKGHAREAFFNRISKIANEMAGAEGLEPTA